MSDEDEIGRERWARHEAVSDFPSAPPFAWLLSVLVAQRVCRKDGWRGYVASIAMLLLTSALHLQLPQIPSFGIVGAIPAAVCSWLAGTTEDRGTSRQ